MKYVYYKLANKKQNGNIKKFTEILIKKGIKNTTSPL